MKRVRRGKGLEHRTRVALDHVPDLTACTRRDEPTPIKPGQEHNDVGANGESLAVA